jgi:D-inositol-3-phosphate glycosyltransferase
MAALHIALVGPLPPYRGGISHFTLELARALRGRGHRISAVTFSRQYPEHLFPGQSQFEPGTRPEDAPEAPRLIDSVDPRSWWRAGGYLQKLAPDAVVFQHWMPFFAPAYGTIARRIPDARRLAVVHNALPHERRPGDVALTRYFVRATDGLLALSASVRADLERLAPGVPIREAPHPVYDQHGPAPDRAEARRHLGLPEDAPVLLFFGFVRHYKGLDTLIEALPAVREHLPEARLLVAGEFYDDPAPYRARVARLGFTDAVRFEDRYLPSEDVALAFGAADVVVQPYRSATQSGVAQTAFGFGVPVVTTSVGGLAEAVPHEQAGLVVPPENPAALSSAIVRFFQEDGLAGRLRTGARTQGSAGTWDPVCSALEEMAALPSRRR